MKYIRAYYPTMNDGKKELQEDCPNICYVWSRCREVFLSFFSLLPGTVVG